MIHAVVLNFHFSFAAIHRALITNRMNNAPCTGPIAFTQEGSFNIYLIGTATKTKRSNEVPSRNP